MSSQTHLVNTLRITIAPQTNATSTVIPGTATVRAPPVLLPLLVLDKFMRVDPEWPFDVANTAAGIVAVL